MPLGTRSRMATPLKDYRIGRARTIEAFAFCADLVYDDAPVVCVLFTINPFSLR